MSKWEERRAWGQAAAARTLKRLEIDQTPVNPVEVAEKLGLKVEFADLPDGTSGKLETTNGNTTILVNRRENRRRARFTIAHEIGHFLDGDLKDVARNGESNPKEFGCNEFAAALLMPQDWFIEDIEAGLSDGELASVYDMSIPAIKVRREVLGK